jgi:quercetin dioxygenase-like cupin family protein
LKTRAVALFAFVIGAIFLSTSTVVATPGSGFGATTVSKGTLAGPVKLEGLGLKLSTNATTDMVIQQINIDPGGQSGWHQHPGLVLVTVVSGAVYVQVECEPAQMFSVGQSFVEPPLTTVKVSNVSATAPGRNFATLVVPAGRALRIEAPAPDCSEIDR